MKHRDMDFIQERLQALAVEMQNVAVAMLLSDSKKMQAKSEELRDAGNIVFEWLASMKAEETIQGFIEERKQ